MRLSIVLDSGITVPFNLLLFVRMLVVMYPGDKIKGIKIIRSMPGNSLSPKDSEELYEYAESHPELGKFDPNTVW